MSRPFSQTRLDDVRPIGVQSFQEFEQHDDPGLVNLKVYEGNDELALRRNVAIGNPSTEGGVPAVHSAGVELYIPMSQLVVIGVSDSPSARIYRLDKPILQYRLLA